MPWTRRACPTHDPVRLRFIFERFKELPAESGDFTSSDEQTDANGNTWKIDLYPGGLLFHYGLTNEFEADRVSLCFIHIGKVCINAVIHVSVRDAAGDDVFKTSSRVCHWNHPGLQTTNPFHLAHKYSDMAFFTVRKS
jgi:hypothetical protein